MTVDGNSVVVQLVGRGEVALGLTDSDDVRAGLRNGLPIAGKPLGQDGMAIRNTLGHIRGAPHPGLANRLAGRFTTGTATFLAGPVLAWRWA